jgi:WD40 repeat protein
MSHEQHINPFPGLRSFEEEEEYLFFGREKQIDELLNKLSKTRFLAVVGASGSGKSSLVKSGLLPSLHSGYLAAAGSGWRICTFRPGNDPIGNLSVALCSKEILGHDGVGESSPAFVESVLRRSDQGVGESIRQFSTDHKQNLLIVVDQFEELFRFSKYEKAEHKGTRDSVTFINLLLAASKFATIPIYVVFTMRSDFLGDCTEFRGLPEAINNGQYLIPRMTREERKAAITGPIAVGGAEISQALLTRLLNDVGDNPDQLPILQHALMRTWEYWSKHSKPGDPIDLSHYEATGTMAKALSLHAEEAYAEIGDEKGKEICKKLFRSLTEKRDDGRGIRRPTIIKEICELAEIHLEEVARIIEIFRRPGRSFLMPPVGVALSEETVIDISHESLMRVWERLMSWVQEEIESAELYTRLAKSAALYQEGKTGIWRDPELLMATKWRQNQNPNQVWAKRYDPSFDRAMNFLEYSESEKNRELAGAEKKRKAAIVRLRIFVSIVTFAFCLAVYFGITSYRNEKQAKVSEKKALIKKREADLSNRIAIVERDNAAKERDIASQEKIRAEKSSEFANQQKKIAEGALVQVKTSLIIAENATQRAKDSAEAAGRQRREAMNSANIARVETEKAIASKKEIDRLRLLAEAKTIALKASQLLNDPDKDTISLQLAFLSYAMNRKLSGPVQNRVIYESLRNQLTKYYNKTLHSRRDIKYAPGSYDVRCAAFAGANELMTAGDEGVVKKWSLDGSPLEINAVSSGKKVPENFSAMTLSSDKKILLLGTTTGNVYATDASDPKPDVPLTRETGKCVYVHEIFQDGSGTDFVCVFENSVSILRVNKNLTAVSNATNTGIAHHVKAATFYNAGAKKYVLLAEGKTLSRFDIENTGTSVATEKVLEFQEVISSVQSSAAGDLIAVGGANGAISIYKTNGSTFVLLRQVRGHVSAISSIQFTSDDSILVSGSLDHSMHVSRIKKTGDEEDLVLKEKEAWIRSVAVSPDNNRIISVGQSGLIQVWPLSAAEALREIRSIKNYEAFLAAPVNENVLKEELGLELYNSLWKPDPKNKNFNDLWIELQKNYLN